MTEAVCKFQPVPRISGWHVALRHAPAPRQPCLKWQSLQHVETVLDRWIWITQSQTPRRRLAGFWKGVVLQGPFGCQLAFELEVEGDARWQDQAGVPKGSARRFSYMF